VTSTAAELDELLARARQRLSGDDAPGEPSLVVVPRKDDRDPVAYLVSIAHARDGEPGGPRYIFPLASGKNTVCRDTRVGDYEATTATLLEQGQWLIRCGPTETHVRDAWSTNLSAIVRRAVSFSDDARQAATTSPHRIEIAHANAVSPDTALVSIQHGDALIGYYASFAFGRMSTPAP
jgi:hypothetical protein